MWSPEADYLKRATFPRIATYDSSAAPTHGAKDAPRPGEIDLTAVRSALAESVREAEANDPRKLKAEISRLEGELRKAQKAPAVAAAPAGIPTKKAESVARMVDRAVKLVAEHAAKTAREAEAQAKLVINHLADLVSSVTETATPSTAATPAVTPRTYFLNEQHTEVVSRRPSSGAVRGKSAGDRRMLIALAQRQQGMSDAQLGARAGISPKSGTFRNYLSRLRANGHIDGSRDRLTITAAGLEALGDYEPLPTGIELVAHWCAELGGGASRMLQALADAYPSPLSDEELGQRTEISSTSGTFRNYLSRLRTLELITGPRTAIVMSEELAG